MVLLVSFSALAQYLSSETLQPSLKQLRRPAELLVCGITKAKHGELKILKEVVREIRTQELRPQLGERAGFFACAGGWNDEEHKRLGEEVRLEEDVQSDEELRQCFIPVDRHPHLLHECENGVAGIGEQHDRRHLGRCQSP
jgi:hypothetical protein